MSSLIPQLLLTLSPEGELQVEQMIHGVRRITPIPRGSAGAQLHRMLHAQKARIEGEQPVKRAPAQPNWELIARHPQAEIRRVLPGPGVGTTSQFLAKPLEDLGL